MNDFTYFIPKCTIRPDGNLSINDEDENNFNYLSSINPLNCWNILTFKMRTISSQVCNNYRKVQRLLCRLQVKSKRGTSYKDDDIVWSIWKHIAALVGGDRLTTYPEHIVVVWTNGLRRIVL